MDAFPFATAVLLPDGRCHQANARWLATFGGSNALNALLHPVDLLRLRNALSLHMPLHLPVRVLLGGQWQAAQALLAPRTTDAMLMLVPGATTPAAGEPDRAELLGNIVHSFNNYLSGMMGFAELALLDLDRTHAAFGQIQTVLDSGEQAVHFTRDLLASAARAVIVRKPQALLAWLQQTLDAQAITLRSHEPELVVEFDAELLGHGLNLAIEFLREDNSTGIGADLSVVTLTNPVAAAELGVGVGRYAVISLSDRGAGLDEKQLPLLLTPYFSSKVVRGRKGLGLAPLDGLIHQHGGCVLAMAEANEGTLLQILLPAMQGSEAVSAPAAVPVSKLVWALGVQPWFARLAHQHLLAHGIAVVPLDSDAAQLLLASDLRPDLIVSARLRDEGAFARLRQHCQVPVVVWTAFADQRQNVMAGTTLARFSADGDTLRRAVTSSLRLSL